MIMTVATFEDTGDVLEEGVRHVRDEVVPAISGSDGLLAGYWVVDRDSGRPLSVMVWRDAEAISGAMPSVMGRIKEMRDRAGRSAQPGPSHSERYEVFASLP